jgi:hypothetical protein
MQRHIDRSEVLGRRDVPFFYCLMSKKEQTKYFGAPAIDQMNVSMCFIARASFRAPDLF